MRTTLDIADDVLFAAKELARREKKPLGQVISELARKAFQQGPPPPPGVCTVVVAGLALGTTDTGRLAGASAGLGTVMTLSRQSPMSPEGRASRANASGLALSRARLIRNGQRVSRRMAFPGGRPREAGAHYNLDAAWGPKVAMLHCGRRIDRAYSGLG